MSIPMIAGLYPYTRAGVTHPPRAILQEIPASLRINPSSRTNLLVLAGDGASAARLESFGLQPHRVFDDAPASIHRDAAHKMKHWMCLWALREFGSFLWVDWDTVLLREPDEAFLAHCRHADTPKFIRIPNYWATVNCGVYYAPAQWRDEMERSLDADVTEPNDELLWTSVLPQDVCEREEFWWGEHAVQISNEADFDAITARTCFAHVKHLEWAPRLRMQAERQRNT